MSKKRVLAIGDAARELREKELQLEREKKEAEFRKYWNKYFPNEPMFYRHCYLP